MYEYKCSVMFYSGDSEVLLVYARDVKGAKRWLRKNFYIKEITKIKRK
jgi:hypothetical protein